MAKINIGFQINASAAKYKRFKGRTAEKSCNIWLCNKRNCFRAVKTNSQIIQKHLSLTNSFLRLKFSIIIQKYITQLPRPYTELIRWFLKFSVTSTNLRIFQEN